MKKLLSVNELAKALGISAKTVRRMHKCGKIPALCISNDTQTIKHYRFIFDDVILALKKQNKDTDTHIDTKKDQ